MKHFAIIAFLLLAGIVFDFAADTGVPSLPDNSRETAKRAEDSFKHGQYSDAEKLYEQILAMHPDNLYALSNLGIVRMRSGKLKLAEDALKRAVAIAPNVAYSHCTLGVVYYTEGLQDQAIAELIRTLAIDPINAIAREYISIIRVGPKLAARIPTGDFNTPHELELRQLPPYYKPTPAREIGLSPSPFQ